MYTSGKWGGRRYCDTGMAVCGIKVRMAKKGGTGGFGDRDDTSLNGAQFKCCPLPEHVPTMVAKCFNGHQTVVSRYSTTHSPLSYISTGTKVNENCFCNWINVIGHIIKL